MSSNATMEGKGFYFGRHRKLTIEKVENGYTISAQYAVKQKEKYDPVSRTLEFVFPTLSEAIAWVNDYLAADAAELRA